jgi:AraC-like DNA-binding protein
MDRYRERPSRLPGAVAWRNDRAGDGRPSRVLPDGCLDLLWMEDALWVAGPDTEAYVFEARPGIVAGLRFAPGFGPKVVGVPAHRLRDQRVRLDEVWSDREVREMTARVGEHDDPEVALEAVALARLDGAVTPDPLIDDLVCRLRAGETVDAAARASGLSARQLRRRSAEAFGYGPKLLARILRLQRALGLARDGTPLAATAAHAGYADQAHLARDAAALAGAPMRQLL